MQNAVDNTLSIIKNHIIMVSKNGYTILVQKLGSYHITFVGHRGIVNFTIQLYTEFDLILPLDFSLKNAKGRFPQEWLFFSAPDAGPLHL